MCLKKENIIFLKETHTDADNQTEWSGSEWKAQGFPQPWGKYEEHIKNKNHQIKTDDPFSGDVWDVWDDFIQMIKELNTVCVWSIDINQRRKEFVEMNIYSLIHPGMISAVSWLKRWRLDR